MTPDTLENRKALASAIIAASPSMPNPERHWNGLLNLSADALDQRLKDIRGDRTYRAGNYRAGRESDVLGARTRLNSLEAA